MLLCIPCRLSVIEEGVGETLELAPGYPVRVVGAEGDFLALEIVAGFGGPWKFSGRLLATGGDFKLPMSELARRACAEIGAEYDPRDSAREMIEWAHGKIWIRGDRSEIFGWNHHWNPYRDE